MFTRIQIDPALFQLFWDKWYAGDFNGLRIGQAFYNEFNLHKMTQTRELDDLYQADGQLAMQMISDLTVIS